jgi:mono/diheme cytochrome c family protein
LIGASSPFDKGKNTMNIPGLSSVRWPKLLVALVVIAGAVVIIGRFNNPGGGTTSTKPGLVVAVSEPETYSALGRDGKTLFDQNCAACHGANASGTDTGPPLVHNIYNPGHHADDSFFLAARNGVRAHHWPYGDMPPVDGVSEAQVRAIATYVRELQAANGIITQPHMM